jgi:anti-anti-sigma factor
MLEGALPEAVIVVVGPFAGPTVERWANLIVEAVALGPRRLIIDLADSPVLDAAAIAVLLAAHRAMVRAGGRLILREPADRVRRLLRLARVDGVFDTAAAARPLLNVRASHFLMH